MAYATYPSRRYYPAAAKKGTTWGTAVAVGALNGILMSGDSGLTLKQPYQEYQPNNQVMGQDGILGLVDAIEITPPTNLQYEMGAFGTLLAMLFGTAGAPSKVGPTLAYKHTFQWADSSDYFATYVEGRPGKAWECASAVPYKLQVKVSGSYIEARLTLRGNNVVDTSATNTDTQLAAITYASKGNFVNFIHGQFLLNAQSGAGLASPTDAIDISDFELNLERSVDAIHILGGNNIAQPKEGAFPKASLKITLPRATSANMAYLADFLALTSKKASLTFVGANIETSYYYTVAFLMPRLVFAGPPEAKLEDIIKNGLTFNLQEASANPTGMSHVRPYMEITNLLATDYLA